MVTTPDEPARQAEVLDEGKSGLVGEEEDDEGLLKF